MSKWKRISKLRDTHPLHGDHFFNGETVITDKVNEKVPLREIMEIVQQIRSSVVENIGIDFFQTFENEKGERLYVIDRMSRYELGDEDVSTPEKVKGNYHTQVFGESQLDWLRKYYPFKNGIPSHDTINRVFSSLEDITVI